MGFRRSGRPIEHVARAPDQARWLTLGTPGQAALGRCRRQTSRPRGEWLRVYRRRSGLVRRRLRRPVVVARIGVVPLDKLASSLLGATTPKGHLEAEGWSRLRPQTSLSLPGAKDYRGGALIGPRREGESVFGPVLVRRRLSRRAEPRQGSCVESPAPQERLANPSRGGSRAIQDQARHRWRTIRSALKQTAPGRSELPGRA